MKDIDIDMIDNEIEQYQNALEMSNRFKKSNSNQGKLEEEVKQMGIEMIR